MTGAVATFHIVGDADAIFLYSYGVPYLNGRFIGFRYGADGACRTHFRTLGALRPAIAAFVGHFRLHQSCEVGGRTQHLVGTYRYAELAGRTVLRKVAGAH